MTPQTQAALAVIDHHEGVAALVSPLRRDLLNRLHAEPASATGLARKLGLPRQKINYHIRALESAGLLELADEQKRRGCTERRFRPTARAYLISPDFVGDWPTDANALRDQFSSAYLITLAGQVVRDVARLRRGADQADKKLATFALHVDVRFRSPAERTAFAEELTDAVARLAARYHDDSAAGRTYRFVIGGHPVAPDPKEKG
jgi:DNA-binding transcriptional ArsR family regulator